MDFVRVGTYGWAGNYGGKCIVWMDGWDGWDGMGCWFLEDSLRCAGQVVKAAKVIQMDGLQAGGANALRGVS